MAKVRFDGQTVDCCPVRRVTGTDDWIMQSAQHTSRLTPGTLFRVTQDEIISMAEVEIAVPGSDMGFGQMESAMAKEREKLPTPAQVIRDNPSIAHDAPNKVG